MPLLRQIEDEPGDDHLDGVGRRVGDGDSSTTAATCSSTGSTITTNPPSGRAAPVDDRRRVPRASRAHRRRGPAVRRTQRARPGRRALGRQLHPGRRRDGPARQPRLDVRRLGSSASPTTIRSSVWPSATPSSPTPFIRDVAVAMLRRTSWMDDFETRAEAAAANSRPGGAGRRPPAMRWRCSRTRSLSCELAVLDRSSTRTSSPDSSRAACTTAVASDPARLRDGYGVIGGLTRLANGALDDGFGPGMARGVANSMIGYVDTLGRGRSTRRTAVQVRVTTIGEHRFTIELGTYEEVRNLFGAIARDVEAQAALGVVLGAYMNTVIAELGTDIADAQRRRPCRPVRRPARRRRHRRAGGDDRRGGRRRRRRTECSSGAIGFGSAPCSHRRSVAGPLVGFVVAQIVRRRTNQHGPRRSRSTMPDGRLRHVAYDAIIVATVTLARTDRATQDSRSVCTTTMRPSLRQIDDHLERLAELDAAGDAEAYHDEVSDMVDFIEQRTPRPRRVRHRDPFDPRGQRSHRGPR